MDKVSFTVNGEFDKQDMLDFASFLGCPEGVDKLNYVGTLMEANIVDMFCAGGFAMVAGASNENELKDMIRARTKAQMRFGMGETHYNEDNGV